MRTGDGGLNFAITGSNHAAIAQAAEQFTRRIEREMPQISNLRVECQATQPQISLNIDRERAANLGVAIGDLANTIRVLVDGYE